MALSLCFVAIPRSPLCSLSKPLPLKLQKNQHQAMYGKLMATSQTSEQMETIRRSAKYQPSIWHYDFIQSIESDYKGESYVSRAEQLKKEIRSLLEATTVPLACLELIDKLQRLGLGYQFEREVNRAIETFLVNPTCSDDLYTTALRFRILRQNGFKVIPDVFRIFMNGNTSFKSDLCGDVKGMMSLYEASQLGFERESIMDEARAFSSCHLNSKLGELDSKFSPLLKHCLELPLHRRMLRLEARWYIDLYEKEEAMNPALLELAKLDFNRVQAIHQRDLKNASRWWMDRGLGEKLTFARDRLMENFFWTVGVISDPQLSKCREGLTRVTSFITIIDDIYDVYGTLDELELFTYAVDRWDLGVIDQLPDYMKICFFALYNTTNEMAYDILKQQGCNCIQYLKKSAERERGDAAESVQCYMKQAGVSEEIAREHIRDLITSTWTKLNLECHSSSSHFPEPFINTCINLARMSQCMYQYGDGHIAPNKDSTNVIIISLVESVRLQ